jgi:hypothetical protein
MPHGKPDRHFLFQGSADTESFLLAVSGKTTMTECRPVSVSLEMGVYATTRLQGPKRQKQNYKYVGT